MVVCRGYRHNGDLYSRADQRLVWQDMEASEIGAMLRHPAAGGSVMSIVDAFPRISMEAQLQPITRTVLRVQLTITPEFRCRLFTPTVQLTLCFGKPLFANPTSCTAT